MKENRITCGSPRSTSAKASEVVAETKTNRLPPAQRSYILGGESLTPIDFTIPCAKSRAGSLSQRRPHSPCAEFQHQHSAEFTHARAIYLTAAQPVSQLSTRIGLAIRESHIGEELAQENLRQKKQDTTRQVKEAYYQIVQTQTQISSAQESLKYLT